MVVQVPVPSHSSVSPFKSSKWRHTVLFCGTRGQFSTRIHSTCAFASQPRVAGPHNVATLRAFSYSFHADADLSVPVLNNSINQLFNISSEFNDTIDVNDKDNNGDTAIHMAMMTLNTEAVDLLLCKGADVMCSGWQGTTVLMKALLDTDNDNSVFEAFSRICNTNGVSPISMTDRVS
jgi:hypothetical protein